MELFVVVVASGGGLTVRFVLSTLEMSVPVKNVKIIFQALRGNILENAVLYRQKCKARAQSTDREREITRKTSLKHNVQEPFYFGSAHIIYMSFVLCALVCIAKMSKKKSTHEIHSMEKY